MRATLHNPEQITVQPIDRAATKTDVHAQEPKVIIGRKDTITILAQVDELSAGKRRPGPFGGQTDDVAQITVKRRDIESAGWSPASGDRITQVAKKNGSAPTTVNWYVKEVHRTGKLARSGRGQLVGMMIGERQTRIRAEDL